MTYMGGSSAALFGTAQLWQGRANQAWGASGQWNVGVSYQQNLTDMNAAYNQLQVNYNGLQTSYNQLQSQYNTLQGQYNQAVADMNTWAGRANQAWGDSRNWSVGESFEAKAARLTPAQLSLYAQNIGSTNASGQNILAVTIGITGQYMIAWKSHHGDGSNTQWIYYELRKNGGVLDAGMARVRFSGVEEYCGGYWQGACNAGDGITVMGNGGPIQDASLMAAFIPNPQNPH